MLILKVLFLNILYFFYLGMQTFSERAGRGDTQVKEVKQVKDLFRPPSGRCFQYGPARRGGLTEPSTRLRNQRAELPRAAASVQASGERC
jgi:hypothetical protein